LRCTICNDTVKKAHLYTGDLGTAYEGKPVCEVCYYESEPAATVFYNRDEQPYVISATRNETDGDFTVRWRSTDPWRGYYVAESEKYAMVNTAELLAYHESGKMLEDFDQRVRELYDEAELGYARVFARSSNVFYQNYDLFVRKDQIIYGSLLTFRAKEEVDYDNPRWYRNILFDEATLDKISEMFPERKIRTDQDVLRMIEEDAEGLMSRMKTMLEEGDNKR
jgi:hypothetical protein